MCLGGNAHFLRCCVGTAVHAVNERKIVFLIKKVIYARDHRLIMI